MLPQEAIEEFKKLYEKRFGIKLSDKEAAIRANNLIKLYKVVYGASTLSKSRTQNDPI